MIAVPSRSPLGWGRVLVTGVLFGAAAILVIGILVAVRFGNPGWDSRFAYLQAAESVLEGKSPYPDEIHNDWNAAMRGVVITVFDAKTFKHGSPGGIQDDIVALSQGEKDKLVEKLSTELANAGFECEMSFDELELKVTLADPDFEEIDEQQLAKDRFETIVGGE